MTLRVQVHPDADALASAAAARVAALAAERAPFHIALSGGRTPAALYRALARLDADWSRWHVWFGDERAVPADDAASNWRMARESLLDAVPIPPGQIHPMPAHPDPSGGAELYARLLAREAPAGPQGTPRLDLVLLGIGTDGHTASLFPGDPLAEDATTWVGCTASPVAGTRRMSLGFAVINAARRRMVLAGGADKAAIVAEILGGASDRPAGRIAAPVEWHLDAAAAARVEQRP